MTCACLCFGNGGRAMGRRNSRDRQDPGRVPLYIVSQYDANSHLVVETRAEIWRSVSTRRRGGRVVSRACTRPNAG